jgi:hypothetical protein
MKPGKGIKRKEETAVTDAEAEVVSYSELYEEAETQTGKRTVFTDKLKRGEPIWQDKPSVADQAVKFPKTVRMGPPIVAVFDLSDGEEIKRYNEFLEKTSPPTAPYYAIENTERVFDKKNTGNFKVFVQYRKIDYKLIIPKEAVNDKPV